MAISYEKTNWINGQGPAVNADNLNKIETGIKNATDEVNGIAAYTPSSTDTPLAGLSLHGTNYKIAAGLPDGTAAGQAMVYNGTEWAKQDGYGYTVPSFGNIIEWNGDTTGRDSITVTGLGTVYKTAETAPEISELTNTFIYVEDTNTVEANTSSSEIIYTTVLTLTQMATIEGYTVEGDGDKLLIVLGEDFGIGAIIAQEASTWTVKNGSETLFTVTAPSIGTYMGAGNRAYVQTLKYGCKNIDWDGDITGKTPISLFGFVNVYKVSDQFISAWNTVQKGTLTVVEGNGSEEGGRTLAFGSEYTPLYTVSDILAMIGATVLEGDPSKILMLGEGYVLFSPSAQTIRVLQDDEEYSFTTEVGTYFAKWVDGEEYTYISNVNWAIGGTIPMDGKYLPDIPTITLSTNLLKTPNGTIDLTDEQIALLTNKKYSTYLFKGTDEDWNIYMHKSVVKPAISTVNASAIHLTLDGWDWTGTTKFSMLIDLDSKKLSADSEEMATTGQVHQYSAGTGLTLDQGTYQFNVKTGTGLTISSSNAITVDSNTIQSKLTQGTGISISDSTISVDSNAVQDKLVSGTNIKTINNESLLGSGNITISGGIDLPTVYASTAGIVSADGSIDLTPGYGSMYYNYQSSQSWNGDTSGRSTILNNLYQISSSFTSIDIEDLKKGYIDVSMGGSPARYYINEDIILKWVDSQGYVLGLDETPVIIESNGTFTYNDTTIPVGRWYLKANFGDDADPYWIYVSNFAYGGDLEITQFDSRYIPDATAQTVTLTGTSGTLTDDQVSILSNSLSTITINNTVYNLRYSALSRGSIVANYEATSLAGTTSASVGSIEVNISQKTWTLASINVQQELVSGTNIKTINNQSILGSGNISIAGGGAVPTITITDDEISNIRFGLTEEHAAIIENNAYPIILLDMSAVTVPHTILLPNTTYIYLKRLFYEPLESNTTINFTGEFKTSNDTLGSHIEWRDFVYVGGDRRWLTPQNPKRNLTATNGIPYISEAPTEANADGIKIVVLSTEPETRYEGYLYIITGA